MSKRATMASNANNTEATTTPTLTKKQKGRLKKLRKRIQNVQQHETSGLLSPSDLAEWLELTQQPQTIGPSVLLRRGKEYLPQKADAHDHRDVLWNMAQHLSATDSKKRKRGASVACPRIPPWCTLHNPGTAQSIAVIELHLPTFINCNEIQEKLPVLSDTTSNNKHVALPIETRWFQGHNPKSPTDALMRLPKSTKSNKMNSSFVKKGSEDLLTHVVSQLQALLVTEKQRKKEGFPMAVTEERKVSTALPLLTRSSCLPQLENAKETVQNHSVAIENGEKDETFVASRNNPLQDAPRVFAVDCEMVKTTKGVQLARVTLLQLTSISESNEVSYSVVMDEFVKPYNTILDYVTAYSGVTAAIMDGVSTSLEQVQAALLSSISAQDVLIGHSLENDLRALRLCHESVVDTALLFRANKGNRKYSLRHLSASLLRKTIQSDHGHCSEEDAAAALELAVRRAIEGPSFCIKEHGDNEHHLLENVEEGPVVCIGPNEWLKDHVTQHSAHALTCERMADPNRKAVAAWLSSPTRRAKLVWVRLEADQKNDGHESVLTDFNEFLSEVLNKMLPGTLLLVCIQCGLASVRGAAKQRKVCLDPRSSLGWTAQQEQDFQRLADESRSGLVFWIGDACIVKTVGETELR